MRACNKPVGRLLGVSGYTGAAIPIDAMRPEA
jgi:hypothetical protein